MNMKNGLGWTVAIAALAFAACSKDSGGEGSGEGEGESGQESTGSASMTDTSASSVDGGTVADTGAGGECHGQGIGAGADGDPCAGNDECASGVCTLFQDVPVNEDAVCAAAPPDCNMRITATVFDFVTRTPVANANMIAAAALEAATSPTTATPRAMGTSGADGRIDTVTPEPFSAALGIVALVSGGADGYLTATGLAGPVDGVSPPEYEVGNGIHELWLVNQADLTAWSDALAMDPEIDPARLPLGENGGVIGFVRDTTGAPVAGAVVVSSADTSTAVMRYLSMDGTFNAEMTSDSGIFVILSPGIGEAFHVEMGGAPVSSDGQAGSANDVAFTLVMTLD